jgi:ParB family chromosome partitioning protein
MSTEITTTTVARIQTLAAELEALGRTALGKAVEAGNLLRECKAARAHGDWLPWLKNNFSFSHKTAMNWMMIGEAEAAGKLVTVTNLAEAYRLMSKDHKPSVHVSQNSGENEWYTPPQFIESARLVMGSIDTDPASCEVANRTVKAKRFFTKDDNGLRQTWSGSLWMNPPYAQPLIARFSEKLVAELDAESITQAIVLVNNATETGWFQLMHQRATAVCFHKARIKFLDPEGRPGAPLQGQAFLYFGPNVQAFLDEFARHGECVVKAPQAPSPQLPQVTLEAEIVEPTAPVTAPTQIELETAVERPPAPDVAPPTASPAPSLIETSEATLAEILGLLKRLRPAEIAELHRVIKSRWLEGGSRP